MMFPELHLEILSGVIAVAVVGISAIYLYYRKKFTYWRSKGIPSAEPQFLFGAGFNAIAASYWKTEQENYRKLGRLYGTYEGTKPSLTVADPELVKLIMVKDFTIFPHRREIMTGDRVTGEFVSLVTGEHWRRIRAVVSPTFTSGKLRKMVYLVNDCADTLLKHFLKAAEKGATVDCKRYFGAFTMDTIASCAFGTKVNSQEDVDNPFVVHVRRLFTESNNVKEVLVEYFPWLAKRLNVSIFPRDVLDFFQHSSTRIISERKRRGERGHDFLQLVMDARDGKIDTAVDGKELESHYDLGTQTLHSNDKVISEDEAMAQCLLFFVVGYDTTASTLSAAAYAMALNPDCQEELIKEVDKVWEDNEGKINFDVVSKMQYLDTFICETLRLSPILFRIERTAVEDYVLGDTGITIPKGMLVGIPMHAMHHDPEWYPDPEKFDPDRFSPEKRAERNPYTFLPFGAGPRNCLGMRFALMEAKLCLVHLLKHIRFVRSTETKVPLEYVMGQGLLQPKEVLLKIEKRSTP